MRGDPQQQRDDVDDLEVLEIEEWLQSVRLWRAALERGQSADRMEA